VAFEVKGQTQFNMKLIKLVSPAFSLPQGGDRLVQ